MSTWERPKTSPLAERLRAVAEGLRGAAPELAAAQVESFRRMAGVVKLAEQTRARNRGNHG